jgi:hypothetical protein
VGVEGSNGFPQQIAPDRQLASLKNSTGILLGADCTTKGYKEVRKALSGIHIVENSLSREVRHYDYLVQAMKDAMHCLEHGACDNMLEPDIIPRPAGHTPQATRRNQQTFPMY